MNFIPDALTTADVSALIASGLAGYLQDKGALDASSNPNYPVGVKGDVYTISVAGKVGGASGKSVDAGDVVRCTTSNAGGTEASVGTSWTVTEHNLISALISGGALGTPSSGTLTYCTGLPVAGGGTGSTTALAARAALGVGTWIPPVATARLLGNATVSTLNGLTPVDGDAYVITDSGTLTPITALDTAAAGDMVEYVDTGGVAGTGKWQFLARGSGGYVPSGTRAIIASTGTISPYGSDAGKVVQFDGTSNTATTTGEAVEGAMASVTIPGDAAGWYDSSLRSYLGAIFVAVGTKKWIRYSHDVFGSITASPSSTQASSATLNGRVCLVTTSSQNASVRLPSGRSFGSLYPSVERSPQIVVNTSQVNTLLVFPVSGGKINQGTADASVPLPPNSIGIFVQNGIATNDWTFAPLKNFAPTQPAPTAKTTTGSPPTLTVAELLTGIIEGTQADGADQAWTLPTGSNTDATAKLLGIGVNNYFDWTLINLSGTPGTNTLTVTANTGHTVGNGSMVVGAEVYGTFRTRKTNTNTFVTHRIG